MQPPLRIDPREPAGANSESRAALGIDATNVGATRAVEPADATEAAATTPATRPTASTRTTLHLPMSRLIEPNAQ